MWQEKHSPTWPILDQNGGGKKKKKKKKKKGGEKKRRERESCREKSSTFSLSFPAIGQTISGGARGKVHPRRKGFA